MASRLPKLPTEARNYAAKLADARREEGAVVPHTVRSWRGHMSEPKHVKMGRLRSMAEHKHVRTDDETWRLSVKC